MCRFCSLDADGDTPEEIEEVVEEVEHKESDVDSVNPAEIDQVDEVGLGPQRCGRAPGRRCRRCVGSAVPESPAPSTGQRRSTQTLTAAH